MKKIFIAFSIIITVIFVSILSCKKTKNSPNSTTVSPAALNKLFSAFRYTPQTLTVRVGEPSIVFGNNGTMLYFYANSFRDASGTTITSGIATIQLIEMYKPGDMICNRVTTMVHGQILQSGGEINISASMNGQPIYVNKYRVGFIQPNPPAQVMSLFYGATNNADSVATWAVTDTSLKGTQSNGRDTTVDNIDGPIFPVGISEYYGRPWVGCVFDSTSGLVYTNCDAFYSNDSPKTSVSVQMPDTSFNPSNTEVYLILPSINCAMSTVEPQLGGVDYNLATNTINIVSEGQTLIVPAGMNYELVVMTNKNGIYYYYKTSGTIPHNGINVAAAMTQQTQGYIKTQLDGL